LGASTPDTKALGDHVPREGRVLHHSEPSALMVDIIARMIKDMNMRMSNLLMEDPEQFIMGPK
jgi:hypothetical protein